MSQAPEKPRFSPRSLFGILLVLAIFLAAAATYYGWGPEDSRQNAADDAAAREPFGRD